VVVEVVLVVVIVWLRCLAPAVWWQRAGIEDVAKGANPHSAARTGDFSLPPTSPMPVTPSSEACPALPCPLSALQLHSALQSNTSNQALSLPLPVLPETSPSVVPSADTLALFSPTITDGVNRIESNSTSMHSQKGKDRRC
jgi:hypothetical protein